MIKISNYLMIVLIILLVVFIITPFLPVLLWSVTKLWPWPVLFPEKLGFQSWTYLFSPSGKAWGGLYNSIIIAIITLLMNIILGIPAAKVMAQKAYKGKGFVMIIMVAPLFIPFTASVMGLHTISIRLYFLNDYLAVSIAHVLVTLPYFFVILLYQYRLIGIELQEAAKSLGANLWQTFLWIEFPRILPGLLVSSLLVIVISFSQYVPTWIMSGGTLLTLPLIIFPYASSGDSSIVAAFSIWFLTPIIIMLIIYFFCTRIFVRKVDQ